MVGHGRYTLAPDDSGRVLDRLAGLRTGYLERICAASLGGHRPRRTAGVQTDSRDHEDCDPASQNPDQPAAESGDLSECVSPWKWSLITAASALLLQHVSRPI